MNEDTATVLAGAGVTAALMLALGPVPELGFVLQMFGLGGVVGLAAAYRARRRGIGTDPLLITTRWSLVVGLIGIAIAFAVTVA